MMDLERKLYTIMNPVTIYGKDSRNGTRTKCLSLARLWLGGEGDPDDLSRPGWDKFAVATTWEQDPDGPVIEGSLSSVVMSDDDLIAALKLLFPNGELNT